MTRVSNYDYWCFITVTLASSISIPVPEDYGKGGDYYFISTIMWRKFCLISKNGSGMTKVYFMHVWNLQIIGKNVKNEKKKYTGD